MKTQYVLEIRQIQALRQEAVRQSGLAMAKATPGKGATRPDASAVLRSILDEWISRTKR